MKRFIGDVHGKFGRYKTILKNSPHPTIQVGDMGVGFRRMDSRMIEEIDLTNPPHAVMQAGEHRFIRGNHDNPLVCRGHSQYIVDGHVEGDMMFIGGALSIDRMYRTEGYSWWADEELSSEQLYVMHDKYMMTKPKIMITHECPEAVAKILSNEMKFADGSRTRQAFNSMWENWKPKLWIFGHWHQSFDQVILDTRFICLNELEYVDVNVTADDPTVLHCAR
jgi:hypothetical protein